MKLTSHTIQIPSAFELSDVVQAHTQSNLFYGISKDARLVKIQTDNQRILEEIPMDKGKINWDKSVSLHLSANDRYLALVNDYAQYGQVYDLTKQTAVLELDRKDYHVEQTKFPLIFFERADKTYLVHGTDWNHIEITDLETCQVLTERTTNVYEGEQYLDYFYGELHLSPDQKHLVSSGWVWQPVSVIKFVNLEKWFTKNNSEPEVDNESDIGIWSYYWDRALCWVNDTTIAYLYDPKEAGADDEELAEMQLKREHSYVLLYDIAKGKITQRIVFDYPRDEQHYEAKANCQLFFDQHLVMSSDQGTYVIELPQGKVMFEEPSLTIRKFNPVTGVFYGLRDNSVVWATLEGPTNN